ncbi:hypothetical protein PIB30_094545 [Stylosanthes scabra]|uniref:Uncharacterized protein n=1 Tax=Stylosanthes scabra TaxID=79078 RepID=A0ABU6RW01_9FABA|nr:hypothetical protein [Stylosanthes scabra]
MQAHPFESAKETPPIEVKLASRHSTPRQNLPLEISKGQPDAQTRNGPYPPEPGKVTGRKDQPPPTYNPPRPPGQPSASSHGRTREAHQLPPPKAK